MAISQSDMESEILDFYNKSGDYSQLNIPGLTPQQLRDLSGKLWKNVFEKGFTNIDPSSSAVATAAALVEAILTGPQVEDFGASFYGAVSSFYSTVGNGMSGYSTLSPPGPLLLSAPTDDPNLSASILSAQIQANGSTGISINTTSGIPKPWS